MIKYLDRYIISKFLKTFGFAVLIFTILSIVVNFSEMVHRFLDKANNISWSEIIFDYYLWFIPYINAQLIPLYVLISVIFFTSRLAGNSEILAMLNAGMSLRRIAVPYLVAAGLIAGLGLLLNHVVAPYGNQYRYTFERERMKRGKDIGRHNEVHLFMTPTSKAYVRHYSKSDSLARDLRLETFEGNKLVKIVTATRAKWSGVDSTWELANRTYRSFTEDGESFRVVRGGEALDTTLALYPSDFVVYDSEKDQMSTGALMRHIEDIRLRGVGNATSYEVERDKRTAEPLSVFILTIIGLSIAGRKTRGGLGGNLVMGISLGLLFVFLSRFSHTLANSSSIAPWLGVWIPNIFFALIALWLFSRAQQ